MIAADLAVQRPPDARLLVVDRRGHLTHAPRSRLIDVLRPGDLVIANDAATLPASLQGVHVPTGRPVEARLAARRSLDPSDVHAFVAVIFGAGDFHTRTEDRPLPPVLVPGDRLIFRRGDASLSASVGVRLDHPRLVTLCFEAAPDAVWSGLARIGRPIQYTHMPIPLELWDVWTPVAALPAAFEPPSAGFVLDWRTVGSLRERGIGFATITLAAGISSTGDPDLDRRLPFDEPYRISTATATAIRLTQAERRRIVAVGTTVVRALEHAAARDGVVHAGDGIATQRVGSSSELRVVDVILSGTHEPDSSHYQLLRAFADDVTLGAVSEALESRGYRTHEFGDSVLVEKMSALARLTRRACARDAYARSA